MYVCVTNLETGITIIKPSAIIKRPLIASPSVRFHFIVFVVTSRKSFISSFVDSPHGPDEVNDRRIDQAESSFLYFPMPRRFNSTRYLSIGRLRLEPLSGSN